MHALPQNVFKAYDIRGIVPEQINQDFAFLLGRALGQRARQFAHTQIVLGFDGRHSSPHLAQQLSAGIRDQGVQVINLGMVPTPLVYFYTYHHQIGAAVAITGSHNPPDYNGFKMMLNGQALYGEQVSSLYVEMLALLEKGPANSSTPPLLKPALNTPTTQLEKGSAHLAGTEQVIKVIPDYIQRIASDIQLSRPMKIAIDCGSGVGGVVAEDLFRRLGCDIDALYCEVDADFPHHHPDPADPHNLQDLIEHVQSSDCEIGLAFDGDADRLGVVTKTGQIIWPDRQLILFSQDVLSRVPGATIVYDVKCSRHVGEQIEAAGGKALMWQTGHSLIKHKMLLEQAALGGEMSGHIFFKERWYGFDDGLYTGARLLEILSRHENASAVLEALPQDISTPELKIQMQDGQPHALIAQLQAQAELPKATRLIKIDGIRAEYPYGFGLARASNTTPVIVLRFEAQDQASLAQIQADFRSLFQQFAPDVTLPF
ncbi:MAG: phosphomannomutase/phosphoglucomutase [Pelistega sp.]|nr:phosphomannomutase/phosphoglucomutase [Pelistega sp.]